MAFTTMDLIQKAVDDIAQQEENRRKKNRDDLIRRVKSALGVDLQEADFWDPNGVPYDSMHQMAFPLGWKVHANGFGVVQMWPVCRSCRRCKGTDPHSQAAKLDPNDPTNSYDRVKAIVKDVLSDPEWKDWICPSCRTKGNTGLAPIVASISKAPLPKVSNKPYPAPSRRYDLED